MFDGCSSLTSAPDLPATTLAYGCYRSMFDDCTSLSAAPELPATTLADYCYVFMFYNCTSLAAAPELPAQTLADNCYANMFYHCSRLASINVSFSAWSSSNATTWWLYNAGTAATSTKTFTCPAALGTDETIIRGDSACPEGWTVINT